MIRLIRLAGSDNFTKNVLKFKIIFVFFIIFPSHFYFLIKIEFFFPIFFGLVFRSSKHNKREWFPLLSIFFSNCVWRIVFGIMVVDFFNVFFTYKYIKIIYFYFFKILFNLSASKWSKNTKNILIWSKKIQIFLKTLLKRKNKQNHKDYFLYDSCMKYRCSTKSKVKILMAPPSNLLVEVIVFVFLSEQNIIVLIHWLCFILMY
jgi:hypothetical protein